MTTGLNSTGSKDSSSSSASNAWNLLVGRIHLHFQSFYQHESARLVSLSSYRHLYQMLFMEIRQLFRHTAQVEKKNQELRRALEQHESQFQDLETHKIDRTKALELAKVFWSQEKDRCEAEWQMSMEKENQMILEKIAQESFEREQKYRDRIQKEQQHQYEAFVVTMKQQQVAQMETFRNKIALQYRLKMERQSQDQLNEMKARYEAGIQAQEEVLKKQHYQLQDIDSQMIKERKEKMELKAKMIALRDQNREANQELKYYQTDLEKCQRQLDHHQVQRRISRSFDHDHRNTAARYEYK